MKKYVVVLNPGLDNETEEAEFHSYNEAANCRDSLDAQGECVDILARAFGADGTPYLTTEF